LIIIALLQLILTSASASYGVELKELSVDYGRYLDGSYSLFVAAPKERLNLNLDLGFLKYGYVKNVIHSMTDSGQFRLVGWQYQVGAHLGDHVDVYFEHFSRHLLDTQQLRFPQENLVGVKLHIYRRDK
jgi:hypothetical protein